MDETSKVLHAHAHAPEPVRPAAGEDPARPAPEDNGCVRHGTANLFLWFGRLAGKRRVKVTEQRTRQDWAEMIRVLVEVHSQEAERIVLAGAHWAETT